MARSSPASRPGPAPPARSRRHGYTLPAAVAFAIVKVVLIACVSSRWHCCLRRTRRRSTSRARSRPRIRRFPDYVGRSPAAASRAATSTRCSSTACSSSRRCCRRSVTRGGASVSRPTSTTPARSRRSSPAALADAASRGVEVRLIVDAVGASGMEREHVDRLQRAGVQIGTFNALRWYWLRRSIIGRTAKYWWSMATWRSRAARASQTTGVERGRAGALA